MEGSEWDTGLTGRSMTLGKEFRAVNCCTQHEMSVGVPVALWDAGNHRNVLLWFIKFRSKKQLIRNC